MTNPSAASASSTAAKRFNVVVTETLDAKPAQWLAERVDLHWASHEKGQSLTPYLAAADALLVRTYTQVNDALLDQAPNVKVVGRAGVGLDNIDLAACKRRNIPVVYTPDANTQAVIEYVFGLILDDFRPRYAIKSPVDAATFHQLRKDQVGRQLDELTLGIVGFGRIGKRLGKLAHTIGMKVLATDILPEKDLRAAVDFPFDFVDDSTLYRSCDIVTIHVDGRPENKHMINAKTLGCMRADAMFINAARGMLVNNDDLAAWALASQSQGGRAILDVHDPEPIPMNYPLYGLSNVLLLPHLASRTGPALENMSWVARDVLAVLQGEKPKYPAW